MICSIAETNIQAFKKIVPEDLWEKFSSGEFHYLGAYEQEGDKTVARGALVFSVVSGWAENFGLTNEEIQNISVEELTEIMVENAFNTVATIEWLYVDADNRQKGLGSELLNAFFDLLEEAQVSTVICDVPEGEDFDPLVLTLEKFGLEFNYIDVYRLETNLEELKGSSLLKDFRSKKMEVSNIKWLNELGDEYFEKALELIETQSVPDLPLHYDFIEDKTGYDLNLSCLFMFGQEIKGALLVRKLPSGKLFPVALRTFKKDDQLTRICMLLASLDKACSNYQNTTPVYLDCICEESASLVYQFLPDAKAMCCRRGVSIAIEEES